MNRPNESRDPSSSHADNSACRALRFGLTWRRVCSASVSCDSSCPSRRKCNKRNRILFGEVSCSSVSYTKPIPTHEKKLLDCGGKVVQIPLLKPNILLGFGWPWVGVFVGFIITVTCFSNPIQNWTNRIPSVRSIGTIDQQASDTSASSASSSPTHHTGEKKY